MARTEFAVKALGGGKIEKGKKKRTSCGSEHKSKPTGGDNKRLGSAKIDASYLFPLVLL